jgi:hypothetical protein
MPRGVSDTPRGVSDTHPHRIGSKSVSAPYPIPAPYPNPYTHPHLDSRQQVKLKIYFHGFGLLEQQIASER